MPPKKSILALEIPDTYGYTPFMLAAESGNLVSMQYCYEKCHNMDLDAQTIDGKTALDLASIGNHTLAMKYIMFKKAQLYAKRKQIERDRLIDVRVAHYKVTVSKNADQELAI